VFAADYDDTLPTAGRDLVLLDQRGTGGSGLLRCPSLEKRIKTSLARAAVACARRLGVKRSFYTSADSAEDIEALRVRLRAPKIALYAVSYGTRVAVEYARRHPDRVERMILDSAIGIDAPDPLSRDTLRAVPRVLRAVCRLGCGGAEEHPVSDVGRLVQRLHRLSIHRVVRRNGRRIKVTIRADDVLNLLVSGDLYPGFQRRIPAAIGSALRGNSDRLLALLFNPANNDDDEPVSEFSWGVYAATSCEEGPFAWDPNADPATRTQQALAQIAATPLSALAPFDRSTALRFGLLPLCSDWPAPARVAPPEPPLPTTIPTLVLSGEVDLRTPLESARRLATALHGRVVVERGVGHGVLGANPYGCASPAVAAFLAGRPVPKCRRQIILQFESAAATASGASSVSACPAPATIVSLPSGSAAASRWARATNLASRAPASTATGIDSSPRRSQTGAMTPVPIPRKDAASPPRSLRSRSARATAATCGD
jgi:pimeloyl-ACP methyl ester carboxylesterase